VRTKRRSISTKLHGAISHKDAISTIQLQKALHTYRTLYVVLSLLDYWCLLIQNVTLHCVRSYYASSATVRTDPLIKLSTGWKFNYRGIGVVKT